MSDLRQRTVSREFDIDTRMFSKMLTSLVRHPTNSRDRGACLDSMARTVHEKAAVSAITSNDYDHLSRRFLAGPAGRRVLAALAGFQVPAYARLQSSASEPTAEWVAGGNRIPVAKPDFDTIFTESSAFAFIVPISRDTAELSDDMATGAIEAIAAPALMKTEDKKVLGTDAAVSGSNPAGLLAAAAEFSDGSPSALETDLEAMFAHVVEGTPTRPVLITSPRAALWMALQRTESGARFPNARVDGTGDVAGIPLLTSAAAANRLILVDASQLVIVDNGLEVGASESAAVLMDDSPSPGAAQEVSGWGTNTVFLRFTRRVWWSLLRADAIAYTTLGELANSPN